MAAPAANWAEPWEAAHPSLFTTPALRREGGIYRDGQSLCVIDNDNLVSLASILMDAAVTLQRGD